LALENRIIEVEFLEPDDSFEEWDRFVDDSPQGCIFCRSWWLKAVCPREFKILIVKRAGRIVAGMPLTLSRRYGTTVAMIPRLTQTLGAVLLPSKKTTYEGRLSEEMAILDVLVKAIPRWSRFSMNFHYNFTNWLPFYWAGYKQTTRYTYVIEDLSDIEKVFSNFAYSKRININRAQKIVTIREGMTAEEFYSNQKNNLSKQGIEIAYPFDYFKSIYDSAVENSAARIWAAEDTAGNIHSAIFVVYDRKSAYYLISTIDPEYQNSGALKLLIFNAMKCLANSTQHFDLEGSMDRGIENSFRLFGAVQKPYFNISSDRRFMAYKAIDNLRGVAGNALCRVRQLKKYRSRGSVGHG
jgi:lipid II:glycine glycyltransferase (peptidoglycan interpeptide bridge formation enzyme)